MHRFMIQVEHDPDTLACANVVKTFLQTGSHYLAGADWGCIDGEHSAWMVVDAESHEEARSIVPPPYRSQALVVKLNKFTMAEIDEIMRHHSKRADT